MNLHEIYLASQLAKNGTGGSEADGLISEVKAQTALNRSTLGYQRKNLLMNKCQDTNRNGVNAVVNEDGSITLTGSNTGEAFAVYMNMQTGYAGTDINGQYENNKKFLPNGDYIVSGSKPGARIQVLTSADNTTASSLATSMSENEEKFSVTDADKYVWARVLITSNADFGADGVTIYPMIRPAEVADAEYEPYKPSVLEYISDNGIDLSEYVKKTDYPTSAKPGVVAVNQALGLGVNALGMIYVNAATQNLIEAETDIYHPIVPSGVQYVMSNYGITSKTLINAVKSAVIESLNGGTKNLAEFKDGTYKAGGITYTVKDGIIKASGSTASTASTRDVELTLSKGTYVLSGCPSGGSDSGYRLDVVAKSGGTVLARDAGLSQKFEINSDTVVLVRIRIAQNYTLPENIEFKPMLCRKEIYDLDPDFERYVPGNTALAQRISALESALLSASAVHLNDMEKAEISGYGTENSE